MAAAARVGLAIEMAEGMAVAERVGLAVVAVWLVLLRGLCLTVSGVL